MKALEPYRDPARVRRLADAIAAATTRPHTLMEICGGQTHAIMRHRLDALLPPGLELLHGPGCPVCVTPASHIDWAIELARREDVVLCSFGDMLRVPGTESDLQTARSEGAEVHLVYSPTAALELARRNPDLQVVFFAIGFETTAPTTAMVAHLAHATGIGNFSLLVSHVLVPPAMHALLQAEDNRVDGFLAAGHVCTIAGTAPYAPIAERYGVPIVVCGFEPVDILQAVLSCVRQLEEGRAEVENAYPRVVRPDGNPAARTMIDQIFETVDQEWRGFGRLPASGLALRTELRHLDAVQRFGLVAAAATEPSECRAGEVLRGVLRPPACGAFATRCTPARPLGAPMVSAEGACAAYFRYHGTPIDGGAAP